MVHDNEVQTILKKMRGSGASLTQIAQQLQVNKGLVHRGLKGHHSPTLRHALSLPPLLVLARPCPVCGEVHTQKTCVYQRRNGRKVDRMNARLTIEEGQQARTMIAAMGFETITEFWRHCVEQKATEVDTSHEVRNGQ